MERKERQGGVGFQFKGRVQREAGEWIGSLEVRVGRYERPDDALMDAGGSSKILEDVGRVGPSLETKK